MSLINLINTVVGAQNCLQQVNVNHLNSTVNVPSNLFSQYEHKRLGISVWLVLKSPWQWLISSFLPPVHRWDHTQPNKFSVAQIFAAKRLIVVHGYGLCSSGFYNKLHYLLPKGLQYMACNLWEMLDYLINFFICHIHNYTEYNQQWNEMCSLQWNPSNTLGAVGSQHCGARGAVGGSVPCSRVSPQSWTIPAGAEIRTHNLGLQVQRAIH